MKLSRALSSSGPFRRGMVRAGRTKYPVLVGSGLLARLGEEVSQLFRACAAGVICDENTARYFGGKVEAALAASGIRSTMITVPAGENSKSLQQLARVCDEMTRAGLDRKSFVVALGGGVVGDLAGFAAAIYHRGIPYVQVPTTLLAQVDSAIGGKTGVNTDAGKNLLGAIHQPALVVADVATLETLPPREFNQGFAEIIKHAIIADASLLQQLDAVDLVDLVVRNIEIKAKIILSDERDTTGARALLNFGHTVGHAIERVAGYGRLLHGEAISLGVVAACEVSARTAGLSEEEREKVIAALNSFDLPTKLPADLSREAILRALQSDKKFERGQVRFVVTARLGSARLTSDVSIADIERALDTL